MKFYFVDPGDLCQAKVDLCLIIDSSENIRNNDPFDINWQWLLRFFSGLAEIFEIGEDATRVSALVFSESARLVFPLNRFNNLADIQQKILNISFDGRTGNLSEALHQADLQCFSTVNGDRKDASKMIIIATNDNPFPADRRDAAIQIARGLRNKGVKIAAVGITNNVDEDFLQARSFEDYYFRTFDFMSLRNLPPTISEPLCRAALTGKSTLFTHFNLKF